MAVGVVVRKFKKLLYSVVRLFVKPATCRGMHSAY